LCPVIKLQTLPNFRGALPALIVLSDGKRQDVNVLDELLAEPGAIYVLDRASVDFACPAAMQDGGAFLVTRAKTNFKCRRVYPMPVDRGIGLMCDRHIELTVTCSERGYSERLLRMRLQDLATGKRLVLLTSHFGIPAMSVCEMTKDDQPGLRISSRARRSRSTLRLSFGSQ